jgi:hypothetical protein
MLDRLDALLDRFKTLPKLRLKPTRELDAL